MNASALGRTTSQLLMVTGLASLLCAGFLWASTNYDESARASASLPGIVREEIPRRGATLGLLEVPRLGLSTIVLQGDDEYSLLVGAGHLLETPLPWDAGNSVLAGHRDTDFRPLREIRTGDLILFRTADTTIEYVVRETLIVEPTDVTVLAPTALPTLTLITCYPFTYIGPAPKRFVVRGERTTPRPPAERLRRVRSTGEGASGSAWIFGFRMSAWAKPDETHRAPGNRPSRPV